LWINKAQGPDEISSRLLKDIHREIASILTTTFQRSLDIGVVPTDWEYAISTPALTKVSKSKLSDYRQILLTYTPSKLKEHVIHSVKYGGIHTSATSIQIGHSLRLFSRAGYAS